MSESLNVSPESLDNKNIWMSYLISQGQPELQRDLLILHIANNPQDSELSDRYKAALNNMDSNRVGKAVTKFACGPHHPKIRQLDLQIELNDAAEIKLTAENPPTALSIADFLISRDSEYVYTGRKRPESSQKYYNLKHPNISILLHFGLIEPSYEKEEIQSVVTTGFEDLMAKITLISQSGGNEDEAMMTGAFLALLHSYRENFSQFNDLVCPKIEITEAALANSNVIY